MSDTCPTSSTPRLSSRRNFLRLGLATTLASAAGVLGANATPAATPRPQNGLTPDQALARLIQGNQRSISSNTKAPAFIAEHSTLIPGQNPFAGILSFSDSRVAPEHAFDTDLGDLFVVRQTENFLNKESFVSFDYSVLALKTPLLVVLGDSSPNAIQNVRRSVEKLQVATPILKEAVASGKVKVVGGVYNPATGAVDFLS